MKTEPRCNSREIIANRISVSFMPRPSNDDVAQDKLARFKRIQKTITTLEKQLAQILNQGELAPPGAWVARYQVRQKLKKYWYYKLQSSTPYFPGATSSKLSKYKHLGKAGTQAHIDAVMSVMRRTIFAEIQSIIYTLDDCLLSISSGSEHEEEKPQD